MSRVTLLSLSCTSGLLGIWIGANKDAIKKTLTECKLRKPHSINTEHNIGLFPIVSAAKTSPDNQALTENYNKPAIPTVNSRTQEILRHGFPGFENLRTHGDYVISYDHRTRTPRWVFEHLTRNSVERIKGVHRSESEFLEDASIHKFFRATNSDYRGSGYDRGHMAAAANHRLSQEAMDQTFVLSNVAPQVGEGFNRGAWNQLEKYVRVLTKEHPNVYVCTGPLFLPRKDSGKMYVKYEVIGPNHVSVPTHFFKIVVAEKPARGTYEMLCFVMPNEDLGEKVDLRKYMVPKEAIERASGLLFFEKLPSTQLLRINGK